MSKKGGYKPGCKIYNDPNDPSIKMRKCLGPDCGKMFLSNWAGNRICPQCKLSNFWRESAGLIYSSDNEIITTKSER